MNENSQKIQTIRIICLGDMNLEFEIERTEASS